MEEPTRSQGGSRVTEMQEMGLVFSEVPENTPYRCEKRAQAQALLCCCFSILSWGHCITRQFLCPRPWAHVLEVSSLLERLRCTPERGSFPVSLICLRSICCRFYFYLIVPPRFLVLRVYDLIYPEAPHFLRFKGPLVGYKILGLKVAVSWYILN